jgi:hypothetical protein
MEKPPKIDEFLEPEQEDWDFSNLNWLKLIQEAKEKRKDKILKATEFIEMALDSEEERLIGHQIAGYEIVGYDEPTETWIISLKLKDKIDSQEFERINELLKDRGQVMFGDPAINPDAYFFLLSESEKPIN